MKESVSIKAKLIVRFLIFGLIPAIIIGYVGVSKATGAIKNEVEFYANQIINLVSKTIDDMAVGVDKEYEQLTAHLEFNQVMYQYMNLGQAFKDTKAIIKPIEDIYISNTNIQAARVITEKGEISVGDWQDVETSWQQLESQGILEQVIDAKKSIWIPNYNNQGEIIVFRHIPNMYEKQYKGIVAFKINRKKLLSIIDNEDMKKYQQSLIIIDEAKNIVLEGNQTLIGQPIQDVYKNLYDYAQGYDFAENNKGYFGKEQFVMYTPCNQNRWQLIMKIPTKQILREVDEIRNLGINIVIGAAMIICVMSLLMAREFTRPINRLVGYMKSSEGGDLTLEIDTRGNKEIHVLSKSYSNLLSNIRSMIKNTMGVLSEVKEKSEIVEQRARGSYETAKEFSFAIEDITKGTINQAKEVEYSANEMIKLETSINQMTEKFEEVVLISQEAAELSNRSMEMMTNLDLQTEESQKVTFNIGCEIRDLAYKTEEIIEVVKLIEHISEQTNLLSLNAAIEAARAGAYGRGFSVVAEEVRKLAGSSKEAIEKVSKIVVGIQNQMNGTRISAENANQTFEKQLVMTKETRKVFEEIIGGMNYIVEQMQEVHQHVGTIGANKEGVMKSIQKIESVVEEVVASTEELLSSSTEQMQAADGMAILAKELAENIEALNESSKKFKV